MGLFLLLSLAEPFVLSLLPEPASLTIEEAADSPAALHLTCPATWTRSRWNCRLNIGSKLRLGFPCMLSLLRHGSPAVVSAGLCECSAGNESTAIANTAQK